MWEIIKQGNYVPIQQTQGPLQEGPAQPLNQVAIPRDQWTGA